MKKPIASSTIGARINGARKTYRMSQAQLGDNLGVTRAAISQYEQDKIRPREEVIQKLARMFNTEPEWFAHGKGGAPDPLNVPLSIPEIDLTRINNKVADLRNLTTGREWSLPMALFFDGGVLISPNDLVAFAAPSNAPPIHAADRVVVDLKKRTGRGVFLSFEAKTGVRLRRFDQAGGPDILGRVAAYFRTI